MRQELPVIRRSVHSRQEQTQRRQGVRRLDHETREGEAQERQTKRQEENCNQQWDADPVNMRIDDFTDLRPVEVTQGHVQASHNSVG